MSFHEFGDAVRRRWRNGPANNLVVVEKIGSTNELARAYAERFFEDADVPPTTFVVAHEQTAGRGRETGRQWESRAGNGAYITLVHCLGESPDGEVLQSVPILLGTSLCEALRSFAPDAGLKWPNDLFAGGRKLGGILIETCTSEDAEVAVVAGFGINLNQPVQPELEQTATCLREAAQGDVPDLPGLVVHLCEHVSEGLAQLGDLGGAVDRYRSLSIHSEGDMLSCRLGDREIHGIFRGFDERGCLCLEADGEQVTVAAGEVILEHPPL
ncbi:MAG: biotin--[acetyl-CoA-carboxylase] ligase [Acidobacteriota bacterium]